MAEKSVYVSKTEYLYFEEIHVTIDWFAGFAMSQIVRKNITIWILDADKKSLGFV